MRRVHSGGPLVAPRLPARLGGWAAFARKWVLARTAPWSLARDHDAGDEQLAAPDTPWLSARDRPGQTRSPQGAGHAQGLRGLDVGRRLGEEQLRVDQPAGQPFARSGRL